MPGQLLQGAAARKRGPLAFLDHRARRPATDGLGVRMSTERFTFPLNVYARMLELGEGRLDYLHYGLFEHDDEPVWQAQERASQLLWAALPPPCRVLEVGVGVGTTLRRLGEAGYQALGISPDAAQLDEVRFRHGDAVRVLNSTLEAIVPGHDPWDLLLLQESAQYIAPLDLFEAADRLLVAEDANLVVMDEFALDRRAPEHTGLHSRGHFLALAQRMGWQLVQEHDVSRQAQRTLAAIRRHVRQQREHLRRELAVDDSQIETLLLATERYQELYEQGVYGYGLLRLHRARRPQRRLGSVGPDQSSAMRDLFKRVFGKAMDAAEWDWKYGNGRGHAVGLWAGNELLAHYAAVTRWCRIDGQEERACQVGDVMVVPEANAGLGRQGALQQVSATLLESQIGWGNPHRIGFGFPNLRALKVAERLGLYAAVDEVVQLEWSDQPLRRWHDLGFLLDDVDPAGLTEGSATWRELETLWAQMAAGLSDALLPMRDPGWIRYRYGQRPGVSYRLLLQRCRWTGGARGAIVLREHNDVTELMDLIGPPARFPRLVRAARRVAWTRAEKPLQAWISRSHHQLLDDPADSARLATLGVMVPSSVHTPGPTPDSLRGRWFLMSGDTDFR